MSPVTSSRLLLLNSWMGGALASPSLQPDPRGSVQPERSFDLQRLELDLTLLPAERAVEGTATYTLRRLWPGPAVLDQVDLRIAEVVGPAGPLPWRTAGPSLIVDLPDEFGLAAPDRFQIRWRAEPRTGMHFRQAGPGRPDEYDEVWTQGEGEDHRYWLPSFDHPGDRFVYEGRVRAPEGWRVITNSGHDMVSYLVMVAAAPYEITPHPADPSLEVWAPPGSDPRAVARVLEPVPAMMAHFAERTGVPYPWGSYRQVFVQRFLYTGMENTSATIQHETMLVGDRLARTSDWVESVVAHELAHQWYGDLLTCRNWRELWLNEGFATFMAADWTRRREGEEAYARTVEGWLASMRGAPAPLAGRWFHGPQAARNHNVYGRGAGVLHMLRAYLGEERFWAGVRLYTGRHAHGLVETDQLRAAMEEVSGRDLGWFFQQWVELGFIPKLSHRWRWAEGRLRVELRQPQGQGEPLFGLPVTVEVGLREGGTLRRVAFLEGEALDFELELAEAPRYVAFDPDGAVAVFLDEAPDPNELAARLGSPSPLVRVRAIRALGRTERSEELTALLGDVSAPTALRVEAAAALGEQRRSEALVGALRDSDDRIRRAAAEALGRSVDERPAAALRRLAETDPNPDVAAAALRSLAAVHRSQGLSSARELALRARHRDERALRTAAFDVLGDHGGASDLASLLGGGLKWRLNHAALAAAARIAAREEGGAGERLRARVARAVDPLLDDLDLRTRERAVGLLQEIGDPQSVNRLEAYWRRETIPGLRQAAMAAVQSISGRKAPAPVPVGAADARLEAMEKRLRELEDRLEKAERRH